MTNRVCGSVTELQFQFRLFRDVCNGNSWYIKFAIISRVLCRIIWPKIWHNRYSEITFGRMHTSIILIKQALSSRRVDWNLYIDTRDKISQLCAPIYSRLSFWSLLTTISSECLKRSAYLRRTVRHVAVANQIALILGPLNYITSCRVR